MTLAGTIERRRLPLAGLIVAVLLILLAIRTVDVLLVVFVAVILGVYLDALSGMFRRRLGMPHGSAIALAVVATVTGLVGIVLLVAPPVSQQVQDLASNFPEYLSGLNTSLEHLTARFPSLAKAEPGGVLASSISELVGLVRGAVLPYLKSGIEVVVVLISIAVMALYLARHPAVYTEGLVALVPPRRRPLARAILSDLRTTLRAWVVGQLVAMTVLAVLTGFGLWILGIPYFLAFGAFAGLAAIVPFFGVLLSTLLPALFALGVAGVGKAVAVLLLGVIVHLIEANILAPVVMERQVNVPPVLTIAGVLLIGRLFGFVGLVIAVPILALAMVLIRHILLGEVYGDPVSAALPEGTHQAGTESTITPLPPSPPEP